tara:strand:- start:38 stop:406 length:369 start_codon:yes stop_codon:yes gene_type:complete
MKKEKKKNIKLAWKLSGRNRQDDLQHKIGEIEIINKNSENNKVLIVYGFIDCDGAESIDNTILLDANYTSVMGWYNKENYWSDCGVYFQVHKPSKIDNFEQQTIDYGAEAFENGHSHIIYRR